MHRGLIGVLHKKLQKPNQVEDQLDHQSSLILVLPLLDHIEVIGPADLRILPNRKPSRINKSYRCSNCRWLMPRLVPLMTAIVTILKLLLWWRVAKYRRRERHSWFPMGPRVLSRVVLMVERTVACSFSPVINQLIILQLRILSYRVKELYL